jgi:hypothetical protein
VFYFVLKRGAASAQSPNRSAKLLPGAEES